MESHAKADAAFWKLAESKMIHYRGPFLPYLIERAEGSYIYDSNGRRILDFTSGQMSSILGHGHPEIAAVVADSYKNLDHLFSNFLSWPVVNLAKALTDRLPAGLDKAMFLSTGGESNEAAIKVGLHVSCVSIERAS
jgi:2,2-dialkylglycine decarboxylase (pyruvate)